MLKASGWRVSVLTTVPRRDGCWAPRGRCSSPSRYTKADARGESRTLMGLPPTDFESSLPSGQQNTPRHTAHDNTHLGAAPAAPSCAVFPRVSLGSGTVWAQRGFVGSGARRAWRGVNPLRIA